MYIVNIIYIYHDVLLQATLESESKGKQEALRIKKKLESDINELEIALDHANKANADAQKNIRYKYIQYCVVQLCSRCSTRNAYYVYSMQFVVHF